MLPMPGMLVWRHRQCLSTAGTLSLDIPPGTHMRLYGAGLFAFGALLLYGAFSDVRVRRQLEVGANVD